MGNIRNSLRQRVRLLTVMLVAIFCSELAVMLAFQLIGSSAFPPIIIAIIDAVSVSLFSAAIIWHFTIQPLWQAKRTIEKLAVVASHCQHGVVISDPEGRVEWANEAFERLTGFTRQEVIGLKAGTFLHGPRTDLETLRIIREGLKARESIAVEIIDYTKDRHEFWNALKINPVYNEACELIHFVGTQTDVSERKSVEEQLVRARQAADHANVAKSEFLASMSHELRTPLNGILGMNELLQRTELTAQQQKYVDASATSGRLLLELLSDVLDLSKIEAGKLELNPRDFSIEKMMHDVVTVFSHAAKQKGLDLACHLEPQVCVSVHGDDHRLRQILVNLIGNAIKFTSTGSVTVRVLTRPSEDSRTIVRFSVTDTGEGVPADRRLRLFLPFSQVDSSTSRHFGGTGLGLAISKQLVELMGGTIGVDSELGVGSTFWFEIPLTLAFGSTDASVATSSVSAKPIEGHILVAEDNGINQLYIVELLKHFGCTSDVVVNGERALHALQQQHYDLVLMDCQMPGMDGFVAAREIRRHEASDGLATRIPIVALTANALKGDRQRCLDAGMDDYLSKPIESVAMREALAKFLC